MDMAAPVVPREETAIATVVEAEAVAATAVVAPRAVPDNALVCPASNRPQVHGSRVSNCGRNSDPVGQPFRLRSGF
jgi:hypothetical protein